MIGVGICLGLIALAVANAAVIGSGGGQPFDWSVSLAILSLAGVLSSFAGFTKSRSRLENFAVIAAISLPVYVAFQLVPIPLPILRIFDPVRTEVASALGLVMARPALAPISVAPLSTWVQLSQIAGCSLVFLAVRERGSASWSAAPLLLLGGYEAVLGLAQHSWSGATPVSGTYYNKDHFAGLLEMILPFAVAFAIAFLPALKASPFLILAAAMFAAIAFSGSKAGFLSMLGSLFVMGVVELRRRLEGRKRWAAVAALAVFAALVFVFVPPAELVDRFGGAAADPTAEGRWPIAKDTFHMIAAYPVTGVGSGAFYSGLQRYQTYGFDVAWTYAHDDYLQLISELGVVGFFIAAALICCAFGLALRAALSGASREIRCLGLGCTGGITAILIHSFADFNLYEPANALVLSWVCGIAVSLPVPATDGNFKPLDPRVVRRFVLALGCLSILYAGGWLIYLHSFRDDIPAARVFCRFGICDGNRYLGALERQYGNDTSAVPPADLAEFLRQNPAAPSFWMAVGASLEKIGRTAEARASLERGLALSGLDPGARLTVARFDFNLGQRAAALELMTQALKSSPARPEIFFRAYDDARVPAGQVVSDGLPPDPRMWRSYLRWQIQHGRPEEAAAVWPPLVSRGYADEPAAKEYAGFLLAQKHPEAAQHAWALYAGARSPGFPDRERVFNGGFEWDPSGAAFDWNFSQRPGARIGIDNSVAHSGARSLRIQFNGTQNLDGAGLSQTVWLKPGRYRFEAYVCAKDISTDRGIAFHLRDDTGRVDFTTEPLLGSTDWRLVQYNFRAPEGIGPVRIGVGRKPSLKFDSLIKGTLWIDQVSIRPD